MLDLGTGKEAAWEKFGDCWGKCRMMKMQLEHRGDRMMQVMMGRPSVEYEKGIEKEARRLLPGKKKAAKARGRRRRCESLERGPEKGDLHRRKDGVV